MALHANRNDRRPCIELSATMVTLMLVLLAIQLGWQYVGAGLDQDTVSQQLETRSKQPVSSQVADRIAPIRHDPPPLESAPIPGELFAYLRIPVFSTQWRLPVQEGVSTRVLDNLGAGHYTNTALPGQKGNSAYAGHATVTDLGTINRLPSHAEIIIETSTAWYIYQVVQGQVVQDTNTSVISPEAIKTERGLTLTTCWPMLSLTPTHQRYVLHAAYEGWIAKTDGMPESLANTHLTSTDQVVRTVHQISRQIQVPFTGILAICFFIMWMIADTIAWMLWHHHKSLPKQHYNLFSWIWWLQAGPPACNGWKLVVSRIIRIGLYILLFTAITFACWHWWCPYVASNINMFASPHPLIK